MEKEKMEAYVLEAAESKPDVDLDAFPKDRENPFEEPFCESDVALIVEGKKLHVHKIILSVHSPVFHKMFYGDFAEKEAEEIEIKEQEHQAIVTFLKHMYPVHSYHLIADDTELTAVLPLADFYQSDHILIKCQDYIGKQAQKTENIPAARTMLYVYLCDMYPVQKHFDALLKRAAQLSIADIQENKFSSLKPATQMNLLTERCKVAEDLIRQENMRGRKLARDIYRLSGDYYDTECSKCKNKHWSCRACLRDLVPSELQSMF